MADRRPEEVEEYFERLDAAFAALQTRPVPAAPDSVAPAELRLTDAVIEELRRLIREELARIRNEHA